MARQETKIKIAVVGMGAVGNEAIATLLNNTINPDMELVAIVSQHYTETHFHDIPVFQSIGDMIKKNKPDVAIFASSSQEIEEQNPQIQYLKNKISTVDCFDSHALIPLKVRMFDKVAKENKQVASVGGGWDPGIFPIVRAMSMVLDPLGNVSSNYNGFSRGHGTAVRSISGIADGISKTEFGKKPGFHKRIVFATLESGANANKVRQAILSHSYFNNSTTEKTVIKFVSQQKLDRLKSNQHGGRVLLQSTNGTKMEFKLQGNNPLMTSNVMIAQAREAFIKREAKLFGAYTMWDSEMRRLILASNGQKSRGAFY